MATSSHCATVSFLLPFANTTPIRRKPLVLSSIFTPSPSKLTRRKNYLRPKLLKTLKKPYHTPLNPEEVLTNPIIPVESPHEQQSESPSDQLPGDSCPAVTGEEPKESRSNEIQLSETSNAAGVLESSVLNFSTRSVLKFGLYLVGAFVFQTICAVWIFGSTNPDYNNENLESKDKIMVSELEMNQTNKEKSNFLVNGSDNSVHGKLGFQQGGIVYMDDSVLENKIAEIRQMARDARKSERLKTKANALDDDIVKTGIEKEVDGRLVKLRKRLENMREKLLVSSVNYLSKDDKVENSVKKDSLEAKEANGALMFKKKHKFRSQLNNPSNEHKGFQGSTDHSVNKMKNGENQMTGNGSVGDDDADSLDKEQQLDLPNGKLQGNISMALEEDAGPTPSTKEWKSFKTRRSKLGKKRGGTKLGKKIGVDRSESRIGVVQDQGTTTISNKWDVSSRNGSLKSSEVRRKRATNLAKDKKSDTKTDLWWLSLPYVLTILMRRGHDGEGPRGLFTLKINSLAKDDVDSSHTVAFEDRGDATNFCYLLQSFFEDLDDFNADIVPLSTKELDEAVKSNAMKVIVVKKGQLQLYAGQPLTDVEMALRSLVKQS